jgi:hypothetical protein
MVYMRFGDYGLYWNRGFGFVRMDSGRSRQIDRWTKGYYESVRERR